MKKATNIKEIFNIFEPGNTITEETKNFYVDLFEDEMFEFSLELENTQNPTKTFLVAGQTGNGKSSALNMLSISDKYESLRKKYDFKYIYGRKNFEYLPNIDVADILFNIAYSIIEGDNELHEEFTKSLRELEKKFNNELEEKITHIKNKNEKVNLGTKIGIGASILGLFESKANFSTDYSLSDQAVKSAVEIFKFKKQELIKLINQIILKYKEKYNKDIILVIDDLEKRRDVNHLFINDKDNHAQLPILNDLNIIKIITMPIHIVRTNYIQFGILKEFGLKLINSDGVTPNKEDRELLNKVILERLENSELITKEAIEEVIDKSGANMNQLIRLIHTSALKTLKLREEKITKDEIEKATQDLQKELSPYVMNQREFLNQVKQKHITVYDNEDLEKLEKAILNNIVFAYFNGATWFEINPACEKSLEFYNNQAK